MVAYCKWTQIIIHNAPRQAVLLRRAPERVHLDALDVWAGLDGIWIWHKIRQTCRRAQHMHTLKHVCLKQIPHIPPYIEAKLVLCAQLTILEVSGAVTGARRRAARDARPSARRIDVIENRIPVPRIISCHAFRRGSLLCIWRLRSGEPRFIIVSIG